MFWDEYSELEHRSSENQQNDAQISVAGSHPEEANGYEK
jgi:hypothetical protein